MDSSKRIRVLCACGNTINASEQYAGRVVKCPDCDGPVPIPGQAEQASNLTQPVISLTRRSRQASKWVWLISSLGIFSCFAAVLIIMSRQPSPVVMVSHKNTKRANSTSRESSISSRKSWATAEENSEFDFQEKGRSDLGRFLATESAGAQHEDSEQREENQNSLEFPAISPPRVSLAKPEELESDWEMEGVQTEDEAPRFQGTNKRVLSVEMVIQELKSSPSPERRGQAAADLAEIEDSDEEVVAALIDSYRTDVARNVHIATIQALGKRAAKSLQSKQIQALLGAEAWNSKDDGVRIELFESLANIDPSSGILRRILRTALIGQDKPPILPNSQFRSWALEYLRRPSIDGIWAIPLLIDISEKYIEDMTEGNSYGYTYSAVQDVLDALTAVGQGERRVRSHLQNAVRNKLKNSAGLRLQYDTALKSLD